MKWVLVLLLVIVAGVFAYVRLSPSDPTLWHADPAEGAQGDNSHVAKVFLPLRPVEALAEFDAVATAAARTERFAGSLDEGRITYVTRSRFWGFPDFTTVEAIPGDDGTWLVIHARARFGRSDMGVNAARVNRWLSAIPGYDPGARPAS